MPDGTKAVEGEIIENKVAASSVDSATQTISIIALLFVGLLFIVSLCFGGIFVAAVALLVGVGAYFYSRLQNNGKADIYAKIAVSLAIFDFILMLVLFACALLGLAALGLTGY